MLTTTMFGTIFLFLLFIGCSLSSNSQPHDKNLVPLMVKMTAAHDLFASGKHEETLESLREILTSFKTEFGEDNSEALTVLSHMNIGSTRTSLKPVKSKEKSEKLFHQLLYTVTKEIFGPSDDNTLVVLQHFGSKLLMEDQLDKARQVHETLTQVLTTSLDQGSSSKSKLSKERQADRLLGALHNLSVINLKQGNWTEAAGNYKDIYETRRKLKNSAAESKQDLEKLVEQLNFVAVHQMRTQLVQMFNLVKDSWKIEDMTELDFNTHLSAYEAAYEITSAVTHESFVVYKQFHGMQVEGVTEEGQVQFNWETPPNKMVPLKFDEDVYETLFSIHRLITSTEKLAEKDSDYSKYKKMTMSNGDNDNYMDFTFNIAEDFVRSVAQKNQDEAKKRVKDIMKRIEDKFGKGHYKTQGAAQIFVALYKIVRMSKEAKDLQTRFGIQEKDILAKMSASIKDTNVRDEL